VNVRTSSLDVGTVTNDTINPETAAAFGIFAMVVVAAVERLEAPDVTSPECQEQAEL
jgi:hypothetical protein